MTKDEALLLARRHMSDVLRMDKKEHNVKEAMSFWTHVIEALIKDGAK